MYLDSEGVELSVDWIHLAQGRDQLRFVNAIINLWVSYIVYIIRLISFEVLKVVPQCNARQVSYQFHVSAALPSGVEIRGWLAPTTGLNTLEKREISCLTGNRTTFPWSPSPHGRHYAGYHVRPSESHFFAATGRKQDQRQFSAAASGSDVTHNLGASTTSRNAEWAAVCSTCEWGFTSFPLQRSVMQCN